MSLGGVGHVELSEGFFGLRDTRLEEILDTTSYFLDRSQNILEILTRRMVWTEKK